MSFISSKQTKYLSLIAATLSIIVAILTLAGLLVIFNTGELSVLNTDAIIITSPDEGAIYNINDTVLFTVIFNPSVLEGQATNYFVIASSSEKIFLQEEGISLAYNTAFTISRSFTPDTPAESLIIRAEVTIGSEVYYNELTITVIDPTVEEVTTEEITTGIETASGFEIPVVFGVFCAICYYYFQKRKEEEESI